MNKQRLLALVIAATLAGCGGSSQGNSSPVFDSTSYQLSTDEDIAGSLTVKASDDDNNDQLAYSLANAPRNGTVNIGESSGELTFTPDPNFNGNDSFEVQVSDGETAVKTTVNVTVNSVNDLPELIASEVFVTGGEVKQGRIQATDIDDDTLNYTISETTKNGDLTLDSNSGELTYTPTGLIDVNDSFSVVIDDGNGGRLEKLLSVKMSLASNTDRAYYYYASEESHLKQAEELIGALDNDINQGLIFADLAKGYAEAGLTEQVARLLSEEQIVRDEARARALLQVSFVYNRLDLIDQANHYRSEAKALYSAYVASKGINAFDAKDASFFTDLSIAYNQVGFTKQASEALSILDNLFVTALDDNPTTAALRTFFGFRNLVDDAVDKWQATRSQADYDLAHSMAARLYRYANMISHRYVSNDRNGNEGKPYFSTRQVALSDVIHAFLELNDYNNAKEALHDVFALYGVIGVDENYPRTRDQYYQVTKVEYQFGLYGVLDEFVVLYPDATLDAFLTGFPEDSFWAGLAEEDAADARLMAKVRSMEDKSAALELVIAEKDPEKLRNHFTNLVAFNSSRPGGALYLINQGHYDAAAQFLAEAMSVLSTDDYISQNISSEAFVTGQTGCEMVIDLLSDIYSITAEQSYKTQAQSAVETCINIASQHYSDGIDGSDVEIEDAVKANARYFPYAKWLDISDSIAGSLAIIEANVAKIDTNDHIELISRLQGVGVALAKGGLFSQAQSYYDRAITELAHYETNVVMEELGKQTADFFSASSSSSDYSNYLAVIEQQAGLIEGYASIRDAAVKAWMTVIESRLSTLSQAGNQQKLTFLPQYANQYIRLNAFDEALALSNDAALGVVEKESIITQVATGMSIKDDFKHTAIASVDTDGDGRPNFFIDSATPESILQSGLELDEDSDNDGVNDAEDAFPLDKSKQ
ncbi:MULTISPECIES: cadherin-like domain-containing protein [unclassified Pseudoalteromonas]|uniref:cadherin-like domain-containing protein n=1 Tax=unclassified Pseudoalteromonas TaxID=194690 RepID=UPI003014932A